MDLLLQCCPHLRHVLKFFPAISMSSTCTDKKNLGQSFSERWAISGASFVLTVCMRLQHHLIALNSRVFLKWRPEFLPPSYVTLKHLAPSIQRPFAESSFTTSPLNISRPSYFWNFFFSIQSSWDDTNPWMLQKWTVFSSYFALRVTSALLVTLDSVPSRLCLKNFHCCRNGNRSVCTMSWCNMETWPRSVMWCPYSS